MDTPSQVLAQKITDRMVAEGLLTATAATAIRAKLADGTLLAEDWQLPIELGTKKGAKP